MIGISSSTFVLLAKYHTSPSIIIGVAQDANLVQKLNIAASERVNPHCWEWFWSMYMLYSISFF